MPKSILTPTGLVSSHKHVKSSGGLTPVVSQANVRDLAHWPFAADDAFNIGIGNKATWSSAGAPLTVNVQGGVSATGNVNGAQQDPSYSIPVYVAAPTDPEQTVDAPPLDGSPQFRIPAGADPASGSDHHMTVIQPKSGTTYLKFGLYGVTNTGDAAPNTYIAGNASGAFDLSGSSLHYDGRASSIDQMGGLIQVYDIVQVGAILHAIAMALPPSCMNIDGPIWPAGSQDGDDSSYTAGSTGALMGGVVAIPASVNLAALGLTTWGLRLATALQLYGAIIVDTSSNLAFYAQDEVDAGLNTPAFTTAVQEMQSDMSKIVPQLRALTNQQTTQISLTADGGWGSGSTRSIAAPAWDAA